MNTPTRTLRRNDPWSCMGRYIGPEGRREALSVATEISALPREELALRINEIADLLGADKPKEAVAMARLLTDLTGAYRLLATLLAGVA